MCMSFSMKGTTDLKLGLDVFNLIDQVCQGIVHDLTRTLFAPCLHLDEDVVVQGVRELITCKSHLLVPEQLPAARQHIPHRVTDRALACVLASITRLTGERFLGAEGDHLASMDVVEHAGTMGHLLQLLWVSYIRMRLPKVWSSL